jgi:ferric-dicitrate binding protein FerR (iron transport regulator)
VADREDDRGADLHALQLLDEALAAMASETLAPPPFDGLAACARSAARGRRQLALARRFLPMTLVVVGAVVVTVGVTRLSHHAEARVTATTGQVLEVFQGMAQTLLKDGSHLTITTGRAVIESSELHRSAVHLVSGTAYLSVPRLTENSSFSLTTTEAEVRVHGTRFSVAKTGDGTSVSVQDGTVEVLPRAIDAEPFFLRKGESRTLAAAGSTDVGREQARFAWQLSRQGDRAGALVAYRRALSMLPAEARPAWADNACAQMALLTERENPRAGAPAWRLYLERFPRGIHVSMARDRLLRLDPGR